MMAMAVSALFSVQQQVTIAHVNEFTQILHQQTTPLSSHHFGLTKTDDLQNLSTNTQDDAHRFTM
jgi:hypothetical protein